jgi:hypothetical protein
MEPFKYADLTRGLRVNLDLGHTLAAHRVEGDDGLYYEHLTTVQHTSDDTDSGGPVYYCNDVCADECEYGSVRLLTVEMPKRKPQRQARGLEFPPPLGQMKKPGAWLAAEAFEIDELMRAESLDDLDVGKRRDTSAFADSVYLDDVMGSLTRVSPLERLALLQGKTEAVAEEMADLHIDAEAAFAAQDRMEKMRDWTYSRYAIAMHNADRQMQRVHGTNLFFVVTGLKPGEDNGLFQIFMGHLFDAVTVYGASKMPEFQPESEEDCGS